MFDQHCACTAVPKVPATKHGVMQGQSLLMTSGKVADICALDLTHMQLRDDCAYLPRQVAALLMNGCKMF